MNSLGGSTTSMTRNKSASVGLSSCSSNTDHRFRFRIPRASRLLDTATCVNCEFSTRDGPIASLYAFDPRRAAILLLGGDKTGNDRWYDEHVPIADALYDEYLRELEREGLT